MMYMSSKGVWKEHGNHGTIDVVNEHPVSIQKDTHFIEIIYNKPDSAIMVFCVC